jgi:hypothetical protein
VRVEVKRKEEERRDGGFNQRILSLLLDTPSLSLFNYLSHLFYSNSNLAQTLYSALWRYEKSILNAHFKGI